MSILFRSSTRQVETRSAFRLPANLADALRGGDEGGVVVDADSAMRHDAVWACITRIAQDVSMMPVDVVRYQGGQRFDVSPTPQIVAAPSVNVAALDWRYQVMVSLLSRGNAWGIVTQTTANGLYPTRIELVADGAVRIQRTSGRTQFFVDNAERQLWPVGDLWHLSAFTMPGESLGLSPIEYHRVTIGAGLNAERFGAEFFPHAAPSAILAPESNPGPEGARSLKEAFLRAARGRDVVVLPQGTKYERIQINPSDSQFIDTMRYSVEQVCRIYGEDPADYGASAGGSSLTYANRSDADLARLKRRQFWVTKLQDALTALLPRPQVAKLNTASVLMMTTRERHDLYGIRLQNKTITVNEIRRLEDEPPFAGESYDEPGIPDHSDAMESGDSADPDDNLIPEGGPLT